MPLPKFNLRDLFWLVVVVAMGVGWWLNYRELQAVRLRFKNLSAALGKVLEENVRLMDAAAQTKEQELEGRQQHEKSTNSPNRPAN